MGINLKIGSKEPRLERNINLFEAIIYGIGIILGAGIYALIGKVVGVAGNTAWISFLIAAAIASLTGLSYAELASTYPKSAAEYTYVSKAFPNQKAFSFIVGWVLIFSGLFTIATVALGFGGYFIGFFAWDPLVSIIIVAIVLIGILSVVNFIGIEESTKLNIVFTIIEVGGVVLIIVLGFMNFGSVNYFEFPIAGTSNIIFVLLSAAALIFFAYIGFEDVANMAEETEEPKKTIPRALLISILVTTILYVLMAIAVVSTISSLGLTLEQFAALPNPLTVIAETFLGVGGGLTMAVIALFATANTVLIILIVTSRMIYGMSKGGALPKAFSKVHKKTKTPWVAIIFTMVVAMGFIFFGDIEVVARVTVFSVFLIFFLINIILIILRKTRPDIERPFKVRPNIGWVPIFPVIGAITCFLMFFTFSELGSSEYNFILIVQLIIVALGFGFYLVYKLYKRSQEKENHPP